MNIPLIDGALEGVWPDRFTGEAVDGIQHDSGPNRFRSQMILTPATPTTSGSTRIGWFATRLGWSCARSMASRS